MKRRIEDYALIGDTQSAGLVGRDGSLDWLCLPRFDSDACFAALLGDERHGRWRIAPASEPRRVVRRYRPGTLVLETDFTTDEGTVRVIDCMPPRQQQPDVLRVVEGVRGTVTVRMHLRVRFGYGALKPWLREVPGGLAAICGPDALRLVSPVPLALDGEGGDVRAEVTVRAGDRVGFVLTWHPSHLPAPEPIDAAEAAQETERWWRAWSDRATWEGRWKDEVVSSLVVLKALTYLPTGGMVAAATTSLPEQIGGVRNWDYRYCWLRDATFIVDALLDGGFQDEARAFHDWLLRAVAGDPAQLQIMYGVAGERRLTEHELPWLPGFAGSLPVRIGNAAKDQFQLDVYGEVLDCLHEVRRAGVQPREELWELQRGLVEYVERHWDDPDEGIWEVRTPRRHFTHSKMMAWVAIDRAVRAIERHGLEGPVDRWRALRRTIHDEVCARGFDPARGAFTQTYGGDELDASLLMAPLVGFLPATDPRMRSTIETIERELTEHGFVRRYRPDGAADGLPGGEGAFLACSFWLADCMWLLGRRRDAEALFRRLLDVRNDVGLLAEQIDPATGMHLGNFPQAFSHVAVVNTAALLSRDRCRASSDDEGGRAPG